MSKKKEISVVGVAHIFATFNNTIVTITNPKGDTISWSSAGANGFKGSKKSTPYAGQMAAETAAKKAFELGVKVVSVVELQGAGQGREPAVKALSSIFDRVESIVDKTMVPHNGTKPPKQRHV